MKGLKAEEWESRLPRVRSGRLWKKYVCFFFLFLYFRPQLKEVERNTMDGIDEGQAPWRTPKEKQQQHQCGPPLGARRQPESCFCDKVRILEGYTDGWKGKAYLAKGYVWPVRGANSSCHQSTDPHLSSTLPFTEHLPLGLCTETLMMMVF